MSLSGTITRLYDTYFNLCKTERFWTNIFTLNSVMKSQTELVKVAVECHDVITRVGKTTSNGRIIFAAVASSFTRSDVIPISELF